MKNILFFAFLLIVSTFEVRFMILIDKLLKVVLILRREVQVSRVKTWLRTSKLPTEICFCSVSEAPIAFSEPMTSKH